MKLSTNFLAVFAVLVAQTSKAEILLAPSFPSPDQWVSASAIPMKSNDGNATAEVKTFYSAPEDKNNPQNIVSIISAIGVWLYFCISLTASRRSTHDAGPGGQSDLERLAP